MRLRVIRIGLAALALSVGSCNAQLIDTYDACQLEGELSPATGVPGDAVSMTGGPFTTTWDTLVQVDGALAEVTDVTFEGDTCADCSDCRALATTCGECLARCEGCVSAVAFVVPSVGAGPTSVILTNSYGSTPPVAFEVLQTADTGLPTGTIGGSGSGTPAVGTGTAGTGVGGTGAGGTGASGTGAAGGTSPAGTGGSGN